MSDVEGRVGDLARSVVEQVAERTRAFYENGTDEFMLICVSASISGALDQVEEREPELEPGSGAHQASERLTSLLHLARVWVFAAHDGSVSADAAVASA